ncbi:ATP-binding cassette domain-containing protein [Bacillus sp. SM2101]|uniref:ATP-binding cassette domain-containing protein n=1 Tax=Bacillus sp. SM2101 TaxID=2805366 RepID=UPI001BDF0385|nr:ATP-binding cassette domain-containing protein [Bacillus sp. SM2101]
MTNKLTVENISFSYGNKNILNNVSFTCDNGIFALLGNNGTGKTTLINLLTGLKKPKYGKITLNGINLVDTKEYPINLVGYLPQEFKIYDNITGYDFLSYVYDSKYLNNRDKNKEIKEVVEKFNLGPIINKKVKSYSGGYKRRLGIAQAVLGKPKLIIIDEPTVGLDPEQRVEFRNYLSEISDNAITIISSHIIEDVELFSKKLLILKDKHISYNGTIDEILAESIPNIRTIELSIKEFFEIKNSFTIIEQQRINSDKIKVRYINTEGLDIDIENNREKEISLENAYIYFQKR